jgi:putative FmdB family regulatory protein
VLNPSIKGSKILPLRFISVEVAMPQYEFFCRDCKKAFSKTLTIVRHEKEKIACAHCGSKNVEQRWSAFSVITSKKSA